MRTCCETCHHIDLAHERFGSIVTGRKNSFDIYNADPLIARHAVHWVLCQEAYNSPDARQRNVNGWQLYEDINQIDTCVYVLDDSAIISFRGTQNAKDVVNDIQLATPGNSSCSFNKVNPAVELVQSLLETGLSVQCTGHSLGGAVAKCVGEKLGLGVVTFNMAAPPSNPIFSSPPNQVHYHIVFDVISAWIKSTRIDKGIRPGKDVIGKYTTRIPILKHLFPEYTINTSFKPLLEAHQLSLFSNQKKGILVTNEYEQSIWFQWFNGMQKLVQNIFLKFIQAHSLPSLP